MKLEDMRQDYRKDSLNETDLTPEPLTLFNQWLQAAVDHGEPEPNAMVLSTVDASGQPRSRIVLLKGQSEAGLVWYTNYASDKGEELAGNPQAALNFHWHGLQRQVRIEGVVTKLDRATSEAYFQKRPRGSQLGAWASPQSTEIPSREVLEKRLEEVEMEYADEAVIPMPPHWGGYVLMPRFMEFWQGRSSRLHDRLVYQLDQERGAWRVSRLAP